MSKAGLDKMAAERGCFLRCLWLWLLLAAAAADGGLNPEGLPQRRSRQAPEDEGAGNKASGVWGPWGPWSPCSQTCGLGLMERSRACIAPAVDNPWDQDADARSQGARTYSQPSRHSNTHQLPPHMARRPSYPLHSDQTAEVPPVLPGALPVVPIHRPAVEFMPLPQDRYEPFSRHLRHQTFGAEDGPSLRNPLNPSGRDGTRRDASTNNDPTSSHQAAIRESSSPFLKRNMSHAVSLPLLRTPAKDSLPLFRPERGELREARPHSYSPEDLQDAASHHKHAIPVSPTNVPRPAQRPRVQAFIKPGKYGYGRVPFSLSLHKQVEEAQRLRRQQRESTNEAPHLTRQQEKPPSGKQKRRAPSMGPELSEEYTKLPQSLLLNTSASGAKDQKGDVSSPIKDNQTDSPTFQKTEDGGPPTDHPTQPRPQDGVHDISHGTDQKLPTQRQMDWSMEEVVLHTVGKRDRVKRQLMEQNSRSVGNGQRLLAGDSSDEDGRGVVAEDRKSRRELDQSEEFLDAPPGEEAEALRESNGRYFQVPFDVPVSSTRTNQTSETSTAGQAAVDEISALPNNDWVSEKSPVRLSTTDSSEKEGTKVFRLPTTRPPRELSATNIDLREGSTLNKTRQSEVWDAMKSERKETAVGATESTMDKSSAIKSKPSDQVYPTEEGQGKQTSQSPSKHQQPSQRQQVVSLNTQQHRPPSAKPAAQPQVVVRRPLKTIKIPSLTNSDSPSDEVPLRAPHHHTRLLQLYSRPQTQPAVPNQTGPGVRSRQHRQPEYHPGGFGARPPHSLYRDPPPVQRPLEPNVLLLEGGDAPLARDRGQSPNRGLPVGPAPQQWNLYHPGTESYHCEGPQKQHKACSEQPCASRSPDPRAVQCSTFDNQEFMGRVYQWEPFTEVQGYQQCELNCRPIGYRFYVRHTEKVQDGTPCEAGSTNICVGGQCLTPGCDGILGSNRTLDDCGACGGDGKACKLVVGTFNDTNVPIGYHKILEIPKGATKINVTEMTRSPNYLALRSRSGKSVINGNWAVDPPGTYLAGSTEFIYTRPGREDNVGGESFTALGPTTEVLDVYMIFQQDNPGVSYRFFVSSAAAQHTDLAAPAVQLIPRQSGALSWASRREQHEPAPIPVHPITVVRNVPAVVPDVKPARPVGTLQRNVRVPPLRPPPLNNRADPPEYYWRRVGTTDCSVTCGKGFWNPIFRCVSRTYHEEVKDSECDVASRPTSSPEVCSTQPCPAFWDVGEWAACSKSCGPGMQHRQVLCRQVYANRTTMVHPQRCSQLEKPEVTQSCQIRVCSHWEISSNWSACSVMCGLGQRMRYIRCISNHGDVLSDGDCSIRLRPKPTEACDMGPCVRSWFHDEWSHTCSAECGTGIQKRSVVCLSSEASGESSQTCTGSKPADMRACNGGPCLRTVLWYASPWSQCSTECDDGTQRRDVICVSKLGSDFSVTDSSECASLEKPPTLQPCNLGACGVRWYTTPWSACSRSCLGGLQVREVRCLTTDRVFSYLCDPISKPLEKRTCNTQICAPKMDENCKDKHQNCPLVVQARLCAYSYYKMSCCASCTRATERTQTPPTQ